MTLIRRTAVALAGLCVLCVGAQAATPASASTGSVAPTRRDLDPHRLVADASAPTAKDAAGVDPSLSRNAARSRMRECGHQWSSMKKNGSASGMTWKDFSQSCLAKQ